MYECYAYYLKNKSNFKFSLTDVDESIVMSPIYSLPIKGSTGLDNISSQLVIQIAPTIIKHITTLIEQLFNTGMFLDKLNIARGIPLQTKVFISKKVFYENQHGFRSDHFIEYVTLELIDRIISKMDHNFKFHS